MMSKFNVCVFSGSSVLHYMSVGDSVLILRFSLCWGECSSIHYAAGRWVTVILAKVISFSLYDHMDMLNYAYVLYLQGYRSDLPVHVLKW